MDTFADAVWKKTIQTESTSQNDMKQGKVWNGMVKRSCLPAGGGVVGGVEELPYCGEEVFGALACGGGDGVDFLLGVEFEGDAELGNMLGVFLFRDQIELVEGDDLWLFGEHVGIVHQLLADGRVVVGGGGVFVVGEGVEDMDDDGCAFDVAEEVVA